MMTRYSRLCIHIVFILMLKIVDSSNSYREKCRSTLGTFEPVEFEPHACSWCYLYLFQSHNKPLTAEFSESYLTVRDNKTGYPIGTKFKPDMDNKTVISIICSTLTPDECDMWTKCCMDARNCCAQQLHTPVLSNGTHCPSTWDGYSCWTEGVPSKESYGACPSFLKNSVPTRKAVKTCMVDGTWLRKYDKEWTDYTACFNNEALKVSSSPNTYSRTCRSKIGKFDPVEFDIHACSWCYFFLFQAANKPLTTTFIDNYLTVRDNRTGYPVGTKFKPDFDNRTVTDIICSTLTSDECEMWVTCCADARMCCAHQLKSPVLSNETVCASTWDGYGCWTDGVPSKKSYITCPSFLKYSMPTRKAVKTCLQDGTWLKKDNREWTDYTPCLNYEELRTTIYISVGCQIASLILLLPALFIFIYYKSLRNQHRIRLHINFFVSFILSGTFVILWNMLVTHDKLTNVNTTETLLYKNSATCKVLSFLKLYFTSTNYAWMFCEGFYLYRLIVNAFSPPKKLLYIYMAGWGIPFVFSLTYAVVRLLTANESCWAISLGAEEWIIYAPNLACLAANLFFLCTILKILLTQIQVHPNEPSNFRRALKATFVLIPLFGVQLVVTIYRVPQDSPGALHYERFSEVVSNSQGFFVALIFCFLNGEVATHVRRWWQHTKWSRLPGSKTCNNATITMNFNNTMSIRAAEQPLRQDSFDRL